MGADDPYSPAEQLLHRLALASPAIAEMSFDIEQAVIRPDAEAIIDLPHVFVSGLARAGTTLLMRGLYDSGAFRSLTYRDMPFVMMPTLWGRLSKRFRKAGATAERAHGDGLDVSFDSPEALEEVFWRVRRGDDYILKDRLVPMRAASDDIDAFKHYVASILTGSPSGTRYLSKNNNNLLRVDTITTCFPNAILLVPYRNPVSQAGSLLKQHQRFLATDRDTAFTRSYMSWLAHHEFGPGHRRFRFPDARSPRFNDPTQIEYWIELWCDCYRHLLAQAPRAATHFISHEALCANPEGMARALGDALALPAEHLFRTDQIRMGDGITPQKGLEEDLVADARAIASQLNDQALSPK